MSVVALADAVELPPQPWIDGPQATRMLAALGADVDEVRIVGGAVREALLGTVATDIDLATVHPPDEVAQRLAVAGVKTVPTGLAHGTLTAIADGRGFEVTTLRRDVSTDGRHAVVAFTRDWEEDAARRDFTMNALYAAPRGGRVFDYHGGTADLARGRVRFIGAPLARIAEDHLRILRFFRFHARFGRGEPDAAALAACAARANDLMALSRERVRGEVLKLLCAPGVVETVRLMLAHGILAPVLPDARDLEGLARLVAHEAAVGEPCAPLRRLAALLPADAALIDAIGLRLRLSTVERKRLVAMTARLDAMPGDVRAVAWKRGAEGARDALLLAGLPVAGLDGWERPRMPVTGGDLIAAGLLPGPEIARRLAAIEMKWVGSGFRLGRDELLAIG